MDAALWATVAVAVAGYVATFLTAQYSARRAFRQLVWQREADRGEADRRVRADLCQDFLRSWRVARHASQPGGDALAVDALVEAQRAAAGLELHAPELTPEPLFPALDALEELMRGRRSVSAAAITRAERDCDTTIAALREAMRGLVAE